MEALRARRRRLQVRRLQSHGLAPAVHAWDGRREERTNTDGWHARSHSQHKVLTTTGCTYAGHSRHQWCGGEKKARLPLLHTLQILEAWCPPTHGKTRNTAWSYVLSLHSRRRACVCACVAVSLLVKKYLCIQSKLMTSIKHPRAAHTCRVKSTRDTRRVCAPPSTSYTLVLRAHVVSHPSPRALVNSLGYLRPISSPTSLQLAYQWDHIPRMPQSTNPGLSILYAELLYSCA